MYIVFKDRILYLGENIEESVRIFESNPGSYLQKINSLHDMKTLIDRMPQSCCGNNSCSNDDFKCCKDSEEEIQQYWENTKQSLTEMYEKFWNNFDKNVVSQDQILELWNQIKSEVTKTAVEAEANGKKSVCTIGELLVKFGNTLIRNSK